MNKIHKANYVRMNVECAKNALDELTHNFCFNDAIIRDLIIRRDGADTELSPMKASESREDRRSGGDDRPRRNEQSGERSESRNTETESEEE